MQGKGVLGQEGQQEPGRCAGEVQGVGGQSWGQQCRVYLIKLSALIDYWVCESNLQAQLHICHMY